MTRHRHLQLNIKQTMRAELIRADVAKAFSFAPDTIVFNEAVGITHDEIRKNAKLRGYDTMIQPGSAGQVVLAWKVGPKASTFRSTLAMKGRKHVSPNRYVNQVRLTEAERLNLMGSHMVSSGWTGSKYLDAWRRAGWYAHELVMAARLRLAYLNNDVVIWSMDANRPPSTFKGRVFPKFRPKGAATALVVHTDATHGRVTFDYVGVVSRKKHVRVVRWSTPAFNSDHDGILVDLEW